MKSGSSSASDLSEVKRIRDYFGPHVPHASIPPARAFIVHERQVLLLQAATKYLAGTALPKLRICDVGCGAGGDLEFWRSQGAVERRLAGTELLEETASEAMRRLPLADVRVVDDFALPFGNGSFDLTSASLVLSTIKNHDTRYRLFTEMSRVTRSGGVVIVYDFRIRKPTNRNVSALNAAAIERLGTAPAVVWLATPFLPLLGPILRLPRPIQSGALHLLPRTHAMWLWIADKERSI